MSPGEEIAEEFGEEILLLVDGVTKLSRIPLPEPWRSSRPTA